MSDASQDAREELTDAEVGELADRILGARTAGVTLAPITEGRALTLADAYRVQDAVTARRLAAGQRRVGYKLGYTSAAMREQMGVDTMNHGPLTDAMLLDSGDAVGDAVLQPRVEPEIALVFAADVPADATRDTVLAAVADARACLEVVDSVWTDYRFRLEDNTADGSSASGAVLGPRLDAADLAAVEVVLQRNGEEAGRATGAAAAGHPAEGVAWLAGELARRGDAVRAGDVVITGGLCRAVPLEPGDVITATFDGAADVTVRR